VVEVDAQRPAQHLSFRDDSGQKIGHRYTADCPLCRDGEHKSVLIENV